MTRLEQLVARLTPTQVKEVEDFAEFLFSRGGREALSAPPESADRPKYVNVEALIGLCAGMGGDRSGKELIREAWDGVVEEALKDR